MSKGIVSSLVGGLEIAGGALLIATGVGAGFGAALIVAGSGSVMTGIAQMLQKQPGQGVATSNPVAAYNYIYGTMKVPGNCIFSETNSVTQSGSKTSNDKQWHRVFTLACHPTAGLLEVRLDGQMLNLTSLGELAPHIWGWQSASPTQTTCSITSISRSGGIVTMKLSGGFPSTFNGQTLLVSGVSGDNTLNGVWTMWQPNPSDETTWQYVCGGGDVTGSGGHCETCLPDYSDKIHIEFCDGNQTQTFPGLLKAQSGSTSPLTWVSTDVCYGHSLVYVQMGYDAAYFPSYPTNLSFVVKGKNDILDPRTGSKGYTENSALCIADYMAQPRLRGGFGLAIGSTIDQNNLISAANLCDETLELAAGGTVPQYSCNTNLDLETPRGTNIQRMLSSCAGRLSVQGGVWSIIPGSYVAPSLYLSEKNIVGPIQLDARLSVTQACNAVKGTYINPANNYEPSDYPLYQQDSRHGYETNQWLAEDGNEILVHNLDLPCTNESAVAQRLAKIQLMRQRYQYRLHLECDLTAYQATVTDVIALTLKKYNWSDEPFEVLHVGLVYDDKGKPVVDLDLAQVDGASSAANSAIYGWTPTEELTITDSVVPNNVGTRICVAPENVVAYSGPGGIVNGVTCPTTITMKADGSVENSIYVEWTTPNDANVVNGGHIEVQYQASGASGWTGLAKIDPTVNNVTIAPVNDNQAYNVQVRAVNAANVPSAWVAASVTTCNVVQYLSAAVGAPTDLVLQDDTSTALVLSDGTTVARVLATWTEPDDPFVTTGGTIQIQYQLDTTGTTEPTTPLAVTQNTDGTWSTGWISAGVVTGSTTNFYLDMPSGFQVAVVQIRSARANGCASAWVEATTARHVIARGTPILPAGGIKFIDTGKTLDTLEPLEAGAEKTTGKSLTVLSDRLAANLSYASGATIESLKPSQAGADVTSQNASGGVVGHVVIYRASVYSKTNVIGNATNIDDSANGASLGTVASLTAGWAGTANVNNAHGITPGSYDVYVRARSNGSGSSPTTLPFGIYDSTSSTTPLSKNLTVGTAYAEIYAGRLTITAASADDNTIFYFSGSGATTTYYIDYVRFQPTVDYDNNVADGSTYARTLSSRVNAGRPWIDFSESIHANKTAAYIPYASGQSVESMKPAQAGADVTSQNALSLLLNPSFETGDLTGWNQNSGTWAVQTSTVYDGSYAAKCTAAGNIANQNPVRCSAGQLVEASCFINAASATGGYADVEIHWHNDAGTLVSNSAGNQVAAGTSGWVQSRVLAACPSGATNGTIFCVVSGLTGGSYFFDGGNAAFHPKNLSEIPAGGGCFAAAESGANVTAGHVLTATSSPTASSTALTAGLAAISGWGFSATTASTADTYNFYGKAVFSVSGSVANIVEIALYVDGTSKLTWNFYLPSSSTSYIDASFFGTITGLSAGSHTFQLYACYGTAASGILEGSSYCTCQRIY